MSSKRLLRRIGAALCLSLAASGGVAVIGAGPAGAANGDDTVVTVGDAVFAGSTSGVELSQTIVGMAARPNGDGYWEVARDGGVFAFGRASFLGSTGDIRLAQPIVGMASTPSGNGYWLVAADGGIFTFGDAPFLGSTGGLRLVRPIVGMASTRSGNGYWLVAADGGIFTFGDAPFLDSAAGSRPSPVVAMAPTRSGSGYWIVDRAGEVFTYGDAAWFGNAPGGQEIEAIAASASGGGYWLLADSGAVFAQGSARVLSPIANQIPAAKVALGLVPTPTGEGYWILAGEPALLVAGASGNSVSRLQQRLDQLGYWVGPISGQFGVLTTQALYALQKAAGIPRTGAFDAATARALDANVRPTARSTAGYVVEIDKSRQLLLQVRDGYVERVFNTSTGSGKGYLSPRGGRAVAVTPEGTFSIYNQINGLRISDLGQLYRPKYFVGGYAIHGSPSIPPFPASHGCVRVSNAAADFFWNSGTIPMGTTVMVYS